MTTETAVYRVRYVNWSGTQYDQDFTDYAKARSAYEFAMRSNSFKQVHWQGRVN